jgi:hypothetical protein
MITNNRTLTAITLCGAVLAASLVSQPGHAGIALNGLSLNGTNLNGTAPQAAGSNKGWSSIEGRLLGIELPPVTVEGSR